MAESIENTAALGRLTQIPRARLFPGNTPLHDMPNLAKACGGGVELFVKRDDCTELACLTSAPLGQTELI
jgi:hypothetical protein